MPPPTENHPSHAELIKDQTARRVKQLVFSGGGAKGVMYVGALWALIESGAMRDVEALAGSSAGAINAALLAIGMTKEDYREKIMAIDMLALKGEQTGVLYGHYDGNNLLTVIRQNMNTSLSGSLTDIINTHASQLDPAVLSELEKIHAKIKPAKALTITFAELDFLHQHFPKQFKLLVLTAVNSGTGRFKVFNSKDTPNVEIALACRASASVPIYFKPVIINYLEYIDGGVYDNIPTDYFGDTSDPLETLVLAFGENNTPSTDPLHEAKHGPRTDTVVPAFNGACSGNEDQVLAFHGYHFKYSYSDRSVAAFKRIYDQYALQTITLDAQKLGFLDFESAQKYARELDMCGYLDAMDYINAHEIYETTDFAKLFVRDIVKNFIAIYQTESYRTLAKPVLKKIQEIRDDPNERTDVSRERLVYQYIRDLASGNLDSPATQALTEATEIHRNILDRQLVEQDYVQWDNRRLFDTIEKLDSFENQADHDLDEEYRFIQKIITGFANDGLVPYVWEKRHEHKMDPLKHKMFTNVLELFRAIKVNLASYDALHQRVLHDNSAVNRLSAHTIESTSNRPDYCLLRDLRRTLTYACKVMDTPDLKHATVEAYNKNLDDLTASVQQSVTLQQVGIALMALGIAAIIVMVLMATVPPLAALFIAGITQAGFYTGIAAGCALSGGVIAGGATFFAMNRQQGLPNAALDLANQGQSLRPF